MLFFYLCIVFGNDMSTTASAPFIYWAQRMQELKRIVFVVNPISGTSGKKMILKQIEKLIDKDKFAYDIVQTQYAGHATEIARGAANRGVDIVCAIGGDGTVNETARALVHTDTSLAIIPCGSGNGLARHLHIPMDAIRAIKLINEAEPQLMDYGLINLHPFFCTCGVGLDAFISQKFAEAGKRGFLTYVENILQNALSYNPETYEIELVDEESEKQVYEALLITCANASQWGNNAFIAPQASVRDGLMDVTIIEPFTLLEVPQLALQLMNGTIDKSGRIKSFRCKNLLIKRSKPGAIHYDGDPVETGENIEVSLIRNGLSCMCPTDEGVMDMSETIQNQLVEHFNEMYLRSQEIQENIQNQNRRIMQLNKDIVNRLSRIGRRKKDEE